MSNSFRDLDDEELVEEYEALAENGGTTLAFDMVEQEMVERFRDFVVNRKRRDVEYAVPSVGQIVTDPESNHRYGDGRVRITEGTSERADAHYYKPGHTVASANPGHPLDAPVVKGKYVDGGDKEYAFPVTRLKW